MTEPLFHRGPPSDCWFLLLEILFKIDRVDLSLSNPGA